MEKHSLVNISGLYNFSIFFFFWGGGGGGGGGGDKITVSSPVQQDIGHKKLHLTCMLCNLKSPVILSSAIKKKLVRKILSVL